MYIVMSCLVIHNCQYLKFTVTYPRSISNPRQRYGPTQIIKVILKESKNIMNKKKVFCSDLHFEIYHINQNIIERKRSLSSLSSLLVGFSLKLRFVFSAAVVKRNAAGCFFLVHRDETVGWNL